MNGFVRWSAWTIGMVGLMSGGVLFGGATVGASGLSDYFESQGLVSIEFPCELGLDLDPILIQSGELQTLEVKTGARFVFYFENPTEGEVWMATSETMEGAWALKPTGNGFESEVLSNGTYTWVWTEGVSEEETEETAEEEVAKTASVQVLPFGLTEDSLKTWCWVGESTSMDNARWLLWRERWKAGQPMVVFQNEWLLNQLGVELYEDDWAEDYFVVGDSESAHYVEDQNGLARYPACEGVTLGASSNQTPAIARQWVCRAEGRWTTVTFLSPDFFTLAEAQQAEIVQEMQQMSAGEWGVGSNSQEEQISRKWVDLVSRWAMVVGVMVLVSGGYVVGRWVYADPAKRFMWLSVGVGVATGIWFLAVRWGMTEGWLQGYGLIYSALSVLWLWQGLLRYRGVWAHRLRPKQRDFIKIGFAVASAAWAYGVFIPGASGSMLVGLGLAAMGILVGGIPKESSLWPKQGERAVLMALAALPVFVAIMIGISFERGSEAEVVWELNAEGISSSGIEILGANGTDVVAGWWPGGDGAVFTEPLEIQVELPDSVFFRNPVVTLEMVVLANRPLSLNALNGTMEGPETIYLPDAEEWSLVQQDEEGLGLYRLVTAKSFKSDSELSVPEFVAQYLEKEDLVMDLSGSAESVAWVESLGVSFPEGSSTTEWPLEWEFLGEQWFYVDVGPEGNLEFEIEVEVVGDATQGVEFLAASLIAEDGQRIVMEQKEINHAQLEAGTVVALELTAEGLEPGVYGIQLNALNEVQGTAGYQLIRVKTNSPGVVASSREWIPITDQAVEIYGWESLNGLTPNSWQRLEVEGGEQWGATLPFFLAPEGQNPNIPFEQALIKERSSAAEYLVVETEVFEAMKQDESTKDTLITRTIRLEGSESLLRLHLDFQGPPIESSFLVLKSIRLIPN